MSSWYPTSEYPFLGNFVERQAHLLKKQYQVSVLRFSPSEKLAGTSEVTESSGLTIITAYHSEKGSFIRRFLSRNKAFSRALKLIREVDLIHAHVSFPNGLFFVKAKRFFQCPLILTEHASYFSENQRWSKKMKLVIPKTIHAADQVVAVSEFLKKDVHRRFPQRKIQVIGNHIDTTLFHPESSGRNSPFTFLHVSTLAPIKRVEAIIEAFAIVSGNHQNCRLQIVSDESYAALQKATFQRYPGIPVDFSGPVEWEATAAFYKSADCFVLNSEYETFSIVLAEALSSGLPLISTRVGIASGLSEDCGIFLKRDHTSASLQDAMQQMLSKATTYDRTIIRSHALHYDAAVILSQLNELYEQSGLHRSPASHTHGKTEQPSTAD